MRTHMNGTRRAWSNSMFAKVRFVALSVPLFTGLIIGSRLRAQTPAYQSPATREPPVQSQTHSSSTTAPTATLPTFDAVSIKLSKGNDPRGRFQFQPGGRFVMTNIPLRPLISMAYNLPPGLARGAMIGAPGWTDSERYNIEAKAEGNTPREQMILMLQSMLADRFKLAVHWEAREMPIYALVMAKQGKTGPQLVAHAEDNSTCRDLPAQQPAPLQPGTPPPRMPPPCGGGFLVGPGHMSTESTMENLAKSLSWFQQIDREVIDKTGLSGTFDIALDYTPVAPGVGAPNGETDAANSPEPLTIFTALQE
jgi:uncharacterized protein (TIGR03435 family)